MIQICTEKSTKAILIKLERKMAFFHENGQ